MLATIIIELGLLLYTLVRYKLTLAVKLIATILFSLAMFQVAEFQTCGRALGQDGLFWSRFGYVFITLLPPLGLHLITAISKKKPTELHWIADAAAVMLITIFALQPNSIYYAVCGGNYVIFKLQVGLGLLYGFYYLGLLFAGLLMAVRNMHKAKGDTYAALLWMIIGYLVFLVPTGIVNMLNPETTQAVPSIMCGFAVLYALILVFAILPRVAKKR
jgi:predicted cobalt transporter CbtA